MHTFHRAAVAVGSFCKAVFLRVAGFGLLVLCAGNLVGCDSKKGAEKVDRIIHAKADDVQEIILRPYSNRPFSLIGSQQTIKDRDDIQAFCKALNKATLIYPEHPAAEWSIVVELKTEKFDVSFAVRHTTQEANGTLIYIMSSAEDGWNYGEYRSDSLAPILERLAHRGDTD